MSKLDFRNTFTAAEVAAAVPRETCDVGRYRHDPRVEQDGNGGVYVTRATTVTYHVVNQGIAGWCILDPLGIAPRVPAGRTGQEFFTSVDSAIFALIGVSQS